MKVLVIGGNGFIGSHIVDELLEKGYQVSVLVKNVKNISRIIDKIREKEVELYIGDVLNVKTLEKSFPKHDVVVNTAALLSHREKGLTKKVILNGAINVFKTAIKKEVKKVVHISAAFVNMGKTILDENYYIYENVPRTEYFEGKIGAEIAARKFSNKGLKINVIRPTIVYGPKDDKGLTLLLMLAANNLMPLGLGSKKSLLNPIFAPDLAEGVVKTIEYDAGSNIDFFTFGDDRALSIRDMFLFVSKLTGSLPPAMIESEFVADIAAVALSQISILAGQSNLAVDRSMVRIFYRKLVYLQKETKKKLNWHPKHSFEVGVKELYRWMIEEKLDSVSHIFRLLLKNRF